LVRFEVQISKPQSSKSGFNLEAQLKGPKFAGWEGRFTPALRL